MKKTLNAVLWKEFKEITRDRKLLATTILSPILSLTAIAFLTAILLSYQPVNIALVDMDNRDVSNWFIEALGKSLVEKGYIVYETSNYELVARNLSFDLIVIVPRGFTENYTNYRVMYVEIVKRAGVSEERVSRAEGDVRSIISWLSTVLSLERIKELASRAGMEEIDPNAIRDPIQIKIPIYIAPTGEPAKPEDILRPFIARLLILTFTFIVTPAATYIVDGIVGERERKTIEMLLSSPAGIRDAVISKIIASSIIGLIASISDIAGLLVYYGLLVVVLGGWFSGALDVILIVLHALTAFLSILVTVSISLPFVTRAKSIKSAGSIASLISIISLAFFVSGWIVDFYKLPPNILTILYVSPYTHSILAIQSYVYRDYALTAQCILVLTLVSIAILYISLKLLDREKILLASEK